MVNGEITAIFRNILFNGENIFLLQKPKIVFVIGDNL